MSSVFHEVLPPLHPGHASVTWFRVYRPQLVARLRLAFASATRHKRLTLLVTVSRRIIMQKARHHPVLRHGALTACTHVVSGSVSSPFGVLPIFRSRYSFAIGHQGVLSLAGWSPQIRTHFHVLSRTQDSATPPYHSRTGLSPSVVGDSTPFGSVLGSILRSYNPGRLPHRFRLFRFRSPLLTESRFLSLPTGNEMFQFPAFARVFPDQSPFDGSPELIAVFHALSPLGAQTSPTCA